MKPFWVYILRCADDSYYTGHTDDLELRIAQHHSGSCDGYTATRRPLELAWSQEFATRDEALSAEMQIKGWSRKKKEAMMCSDWQEVNRLSRGKHKHQRSAQSHHASTSEAAPPTLSTNGGGKENSGYTSDPFALSVGSFIAGVEGGKSCKQIQTSYFLGLDFGTSGARACVIDGDKTIVHEQRVAYAKPMQQTPQDWRTALVALLHGLPQDIAARLCGIAIDGTSGTVLLCDEGLAPVSDALLYNDDRARSQVERLAAIAPAGHTVLSASSGLAKFLWLSQRIESAEYFLHQADWLTALLSGRPGVSDHHNALKTGYDVEALHWPDWVLALPHSQLLPEVVAPGTDLGAIRPDMAARFGISPHCPIHAGTTDSTAAFIASGVNEPGIGVTSLGTTLVLKQLSETRIEAPEYGIYSHRYGKLWLVGGASNAGAGVLKDYFDEQRLDELSGFIDPTQDSPLDYYPLSKAGERFPINDPGLMPRLTPRPESDAAFLRGLLQGLARIEAAGYARLEELGATPVRAVVTNGGGARNEVWRMLRERLLGVPVSAAPQAEAAYGCALLCADAPCASRNFSSN